MHTNPFIRGGSRMHTTHTTTSPDSSSSNIRTITNKPIEQEKCSTCGGNPESHASGIRCVCGNGTRQGEVDGLRMMTFNLEDKLETAHKIIASSNRYMPGTLQEIESWLEAIPAGRILLDKWKQIDTVLDELHDAKATIEKLTKELKGYRE